MTNSDLYKSLGIMGVITLCNLIILIINIYVKGF
jgi:hypothetical protein